MRILCNQRLLLRIALLAFFPIIFASCAVTELPAPINMEGTIRINTAYSAWTVKRVVVYDTNGVVLGTSEPYPEDDGLLHWKMGLPAEENTLCTIWVELMLGNSGQIYYNQGRDDAIMSSGQYDLFVNSVHIPIFKASDLMAIGKDVQHPLDVDYLLVRDINLNGSNWMPIGEDGNQPFTGIFNGRYRTISGLKLSGGNCQFIGLFGYVRGTPQKRAEIKNLTIQLSTTELSVHTVTEQYVGVAAAYAENALLEKIWVKGDINGLSVKKLDGGNIIIGGIVGNLSTTAGSSSINQCVSTMPVSATASMATTGNNAYVGGLAGRSLLYNSTSSGIISSYNSGLVSANANANVYVGGLIAYISDEYALKCFFTIDQSYASGNLTASSTEKNVFVGGLAAGNFQHNSSLVTINDSMALMNQISVTFDSSVGGSGAVNRISGQDINPAASANEFNFYLYEMQFSGGGTGGYSGVPVARVSLSEAWFTVRRWSFRDTWKWDNALKHPVLLFQ